MARPRWYDSDMPLGSKFLELDRCSGRVQPRSIGSGYEWTSWIGPGGRRVLHGQGFVKTIAAAKKAALKSCLRFVGR